MVDWVQTLVTVGAGGAITLVATGLTLYFTDRREQRTYEQDRRKARIELHRSEYVATLTTLGAAITGSIMLRESVKAKEPRDAAEAVATKLYPAELLIAQFRLGLLPAPQSILDDLSRAFVAVMGMLDATEPAKQAGGTTTLTTLSQDLVAAMRDHLAELEQTRPVPRRRWFGRRG